MIDPTRVDVITLASVMDIVAGKKLPPAWVCPPGFPPLRPRAAGRERRGNPWVIGACYEGKQCRWPSSIMLCAAN